MRAPEAERQASPNTACCRSCRYPHKAADAAGAYCDTMDKLLRRTRAALPAVKIILCEPFYYALPPTDRPYSQVPHTECEPYFDWQTFNSDEYNAALKKVIGIIQSRLPALAEKYGCVYVKMQDIFDKMPENLPPSYLIWDGVHPTVIGHGLLSKRWFEVADRALGE